ncbi:MAG: hypothetical protein ACRC0S_05130 [Fusobacteriaceae bacterium]
MEESRSFEEIEKDIENSIQAQKERIGDEGKLKIFLERKIKEAEDEIKENDEEILKTVKSLEQRKIYIEKRKGYIVDCIKANKIIKDRKEKFEQELNSMA